jgi:hypothetical protein
MDEIKIETGISLPRPTGCRVWPFSTMKKGESFVWPHEYTRKQMQLAGGRIQALKFYWKKKGINQTIQFATRKVEIDGKFHIRIWRIK